MRSQIFNHPRGLSLVLLGGWKNGSVSLAADETAFPGGWLPDAIHPPSAYSCCHSVAVVSSGKVERGMIVGPDIGWNL